MHLSDVQIRDFRSIERVDVSLQRGLNVIVGRNNIGKTNLLHAIRHALGPSASRGDSLWLDRDDFRRESPGDDTDRKISVTLRFSGLTEMERSKFYEIVAFDRADIERSKAEIRFEASWPRDRARAIVKRTGGPIGPDTPEIPTEILESLPVTYLPALRDAQASLAPGRQSRLAMLLRDLARRKGGQTADEIERIFSSANQDLEAHSLIKETRKSLQSTTLSLAGTDYSPSAIRATDLEIDKILRSLHVLMEGTPVGTLDANGLGYNNLLYVSVVLEHLKQADEGEIPLLLMEEPEAHLHPQLTSLLADHLSEKTPGGDVPQTIVTTHSPTLAANVSPRVVHTMCQGHGAKKIVCNSLSRVGMTEVEERGLQRMMDVTRASLYFAKGAILVEGISEALLLPSIAKLLSCELAERHISVIPICGVGFGTFGKLLCADGLSIPVSVITDADPRVTGDKWQEHQPVRHQGDGCFEVCDRTQAIVDQFSDNSSVEVFVSRVTLEYELAVAGDRNAEIMALAWESCFVGSPKTFSADMVADVDSMEERALVAWRGICRANPAVGKGDFAHQLSMRLLGEEGSEFRVPDYLKKAIEYVSNAVAPEYKEDAD